MFFFFRIFEVCKNYIKAPTVAQNTASYLSALYITRPDVKDTYLPLYFEWIKEVCSFFFFFFIIPRFLDKDQ